MESKSTPRNGNFHLIITVSFPWKLVTAFFPYSKIFLNLHSFLHTTFWVLYSMMSAFGSEPAWPYFLFLCCSGSEEPTDTGVYDGGCWIPLVPQRQPAWPNIWKSSWNILAFLRIFIRYFKYNLIPSVFIHSIGFK